MLRGTNPYYLRGLSTPPIFHRSELRQFVSRQHLSSIQTRILITLSLVGESIDYEQLSFILSEDQGFVFDSELNVLVKISLVRRENEKNIIKYSILPILLKYTKNYFHEISDYQIEKIVFSWKDYMHVQSHQLIPIEERTIKKGPTLCNKIIDKAIILAENLQYDLAENEFKKAVLTYEKEPYLWFMYGLYFYSFLKEYNKAITFFQKSFDIYENFILLVRIGDCNEKLELYDLAISNYKSALEITDTGNDKNYINYLLGSVYYKKAVIL